MCLQTQTHSHRVQLTLPADRHGCRETGGGNKERVRKTTSHQQPTLATLSFSSIYGNHWVIYKPFTLCVCVSERRGRSAKLTTIMLCPAAVSAAAAAVCLLAVLGLGLSLPAEDNSEADFTLCSNCFYRQTPPRGSSAGPLLRPRCRRLPGGQAFATLSRPTCDTAVYSAFHLRQGWTEREGEEGREPVVRVHLSHFLK